MLHILGMILKIAGILLGSILGIILLISLLVLFVPIRYRIESRYKEKLEAEAVVSWLLSAFRLRIGYGEAGVSVRIRILGIPLGGRKRSAKEQRSEKQKRRKRRNTEEEVAVPEQEPQSATETEKEERKADRKEEPEEEPKERKKKITLSERIRGIWIKIKYTFQSICDKIKNIRKKKQELQAFIRDERNREAFCLMIKQLKYLWKHTKPKKLSISCRFGFDDPALTGQILAAASVIYPFYRDSVRLYPDFEQKVLSGEFFMKGRIRIFPMLLIIIRLWRNRQIRGAVRKFLK